MKRSPIIAWLTKQVIFRNGNMWLCASRRDAYLTQKEHNKGLI